MGGRNYCLFLFLFVWEGIYQFDEEMHPGRLFKSVLVNVPFGFATMWKVIASFMSEHVSSKVQGNGIGALDGDHALFVMLSLSYLGVLCLTHPYRWKFFPKATSVNC